MREWVIKPTKYWFRTYLSAWFFFFCVARLPLSLLKNTFTHQAPAKVDKDLLTCWCLGLSSRSQQKRPPPPTPPKNVTDKQETIGVRGGWGCWSLKHIVCLLSKNAALSYFCFFYYAMLCVLFSFFCSAILFYVQSLNYLLITFLLKPHYPLSPPQR